MDSLSDFLLLQKSPSGLFVFTGPPLAKSKVAIACEYQYGLFMLCNSYLENKPPIAE